MYYLVQISSHSLVLILSQRQGTISSDQAAAIVPIGFAVTTVNTTNDVRQMAKLQYPVML
jgi:hypothetical protein